MLKYKKSIDQVEITPTTSDNKVLVFFCDFMSGWCGAESVFCNPKIPLDSTLWGCCKSTFSKSLTLEPSGFTESENGKKRGFATAPLYVFESAKEKGKFIIADKLEGGCELDLATVVNLRYLNRVVKNNQAELDAEDAEKDIALRNSKIAVFFMQEIALPGLELSAEDKVVAEIVICSIGKHLILDAVQAAEFKRCVESYQTKINPAPNPSKAGAANTAEQDPTHQILNL